MMNKIIYFVSLLSAKPTTNARRTNGNSLLLLVWFVSYVVPSPIINSLHSHITTKHPIRPSYRNPPNRSLNLNQIIANKFNVDFKLKAKELEESISLLVIIQFGVWKRVYMPQIPANSNKDPFWINIRKFVLRFPVPSATNDNDVYPTPPVLQRHTHVTYLVTYLPTCCGSLYLHQRFLVYSLQRPPPPEQSVMNFRWINRGEETNSLVYPCFVAGIYRCRFGWKISSIPLNLNPTIRRLS